MRSGVGLVQVFLKLLLVQGGHEVVVPGAGQRQGAFHGLDGAVHVPGPCQGLAEQSVQGAAAGVEFNGVPEILGGPIVFGQLHERLCPGRDDADVLRVQDEGL
ncbi:hypothetical protein DWB63_15635 [Pseudodesulfovibrio sp. S3]|nr:hypothetical protein DWB63_15635 [Pseudodesulfovibrio sp. S3]